jgi:glycine/D-amino acid oxidase-like deaminating enzyme
LVQRRIFDSGYLEAMNHPNFTLIQDDAVTSLKENSVMTEKGVTVQADVVILSTGFRVQDCKHSHSHQISAAHVDSVIRQTSTL